MADKKINEAGWFGPIARFFNERHERKCNELLTKIDGLSKTDEIDFIYRTSKNGRELRRLWIELRNKCPKQFADNWVSVRGGQPEDIPTDKIVLRIIDGPILEPSYALSSEAIFLPVSLNPTVAAVGAEGVYGASPLTPWEAAIVHEAKAMGQSAKNLAMPALAVGLLAFGALQAVETGNTATIQRAWAMVR